MKVVSDATYSYKECYDYWHRVLTYPTAPKKLFIIEGGARTRVASRQGAFVMMILFRVREIILLFFVTTCVAAGGNSSNDDTEENNNKTIIFADINNENISFIVNATDIIDETSLNLTKNNINHNHNLRNHRDGEWDFAYRKKMYLENCAQISTVYSAQACRAYLNVSSLGPDHVWHGRNWSWPVRVHRELSKVQAKEDTADFSMNAILRILYIDRQNRTLPDEFRNEFVTSVLDFKYWYDEPGRDTMCYWSENHQVLFATAELLAGQLFPDTIFTNSNMTGKQHMTKAIPRVNKWLDNRFRFGFSEWHSNRYSEYDIAAMLNLIEFVEEERSETTRMIVKRAMMVLDLIVFDLAMNYYKGNYDTAHGRTYSGTMGIDGQGTNDMNDDFVWIVLGLGTTYRYPGRLSAIFISTTDKYVPPPILEKIARVSTNQIVHKQRDGINIDDAPLYGIGYGLRDTEEVFFWWGMEAYFAPKVIQGSYVLLNQLSVFKHKYWYLRELLWPIGYHPPLLEFGASVVKDLSIGLALESASTYTYRTPYYQVSGVQDYKPGYFSGQVVTFMAALDNGAYVYTTAPTFRFVNHFHAAGNWTGGFLPRVTMHENVAIIQYKRRSNFLSPLLDRVLFGDYTHAYLPSPHFDEVITTGNWVIGRKDEGYLAIWSQTKPYWSDFENPEAKTGGRELIANGKDNVWIVETGDRPSNGEFQDFVASIEMANITITGLTSNKNHKRDDGDEIIRYDSPSQGMISVGWEGPMKVSGNDVDLGPYMRWDNKYAQQEFGTRHLVISYEDENLELDFENGRRVQTFDSG